MRVLGIESSCDETGVAVYDDSEGLLADLIYSQVPVHAKYGGVVPELASRDHVRRLVPMISKILADIRSELKDIDAVAYTAGPGLAGALMVGAGFGETLAWALGVLYLASNEAELAKREAWLEVARPHQLDTHYPGAAVLLTADLVVVNKVHAATVEQRAQVKHLVLVPLQSTSLLQSACEVIGAAVMS